MESRMREIRASGLFHADENDPRNYNFRPTDLYLARARELGGELEFRFGEQIEHQGENGKVTFTTPADIEPDWNAETFKVLFRGE